MPNHAVNLTKNIIADNVKLEAPTPRPILNQNIKSGGTDRLHRSFLTCWQWLLSISSSISSHYFFTED